MRRRLLLALIALSVACGGAPPASTSTCAHVDGRGGSAADGTAAHPYATIDDALVALGAVGGEICLSAGEHAPPTVALRAPIVIVGVSSTESEISSNAGVCFPTLAVNILLPDGSTEDATTVIETTADLSLRDVGLRGCRIGARARSGALVLDHVAISRVQAGLVIDLDASLLTTNTSIVVGDMPDASRIPPAGVLSGAAQQITIGEGTDVGGLGISLGVYLRNVDAEIQSSHLHDLTIGLISEANDPERMVVVADTMIEDLTAIGSGAERFGGMNFVVGGQVVLDGATVRGAELFGLVTDGAAVTLVETSFQGEDQLVRIQGGTAEIGAGCTFSGGMVGIVADRAVITSGPPASVHVVGAITSSGTGFAHAYANEGAELVFEAPGSTFTGGELGLMAWDGAHLEVRSGVTVSDVDTAIGSFNVGTRVEVTQLVATPRRFAVFSSESVTSIVDATLTGGLHPLVVLQGSLSMQGGTIEGATSAAVRLFGGVTTLESLDIADSGGPGIAMEGGALGVDTVSITNSGGAGIIAEAGASIDVAGSTFDGNVGAAIAVHAGAVAVRTSTFLPSRPGLAGRSDEIRIAAAAAPASLMLEDGNAFALTGLDCPPMSCTVLLASGVGANAIVRPNCLTASDGDLIQGLAQDGGTITGDTGWISIMDVAGRLLDPGAFPALPAVAALPVPPAGSVSGSGL